MIPHHQVSGPEDAPALVLSNSLGTTFAMWDAQADALAERFRLIRYDTRGHGRSAVPPGPYSIADLGGDVVELLDQLQIERAHFAGLSLGGMTGIWLGINAPERIDRLVLMCTSPQISPRQAWEDRISAVRAGGTQALVEATIVRWFTEPFRSDPAVDAIRRSFVATDDEGYIGCCAAIADMNQTDALPRIAAPTLVIGGAQDGATPPDEHARVLAANIPDARLEILDPGAHLINLERPDDVTRLLLEHLG